MTQLILEETDWKAIAAIIGEFTEHLADRHVDDAASAAGLTREQVIAAMRKVFAPVLAGPLWKDEFPNFDHEPPVEWLLEHGFVDQSWHNDVCPSWLCDVFVLWIDFKDPEAREFPEAPLYSIHDEGRVVLATDAWEDVRAFVEDGKRDFPQPDNRFVGAGGEVQVEAARKHLRASLRNQVGVPEEDIEGEAQTIEKRIVEEWDTRSGKAVNQLWLADRLYGAALPYEDM